MLAKLRRVVIAAQFRTADPDSSTRQVTNLLRLGVTAAIAA
ncbi:MAG: hypothetical protein ACRDV4_07925 [Acidimicrobiales bacterium]